MPADESGKNSNLETSVLELFREESQSRLLSGLAKSNLNQLSGSKSKEQGFQDPHSGSYLRTGIDSVSSLVIKDDETRKAVNHYGAEFVKTASLFAGGKLGLASTIVSYGLDQAKPGTALSTQATEFALGAAKGSTIKGMFSVIGKSGSLAPIKGAFMGLSSGAAEEIFKLETFKNPAGLNDRLRQNAFNPQAIMLNAALFTAGEGLYSGVNHFMYKGALAENRMLSGMIMGGSFGFVNGSFAETARQAESGNYDPAKIVLKGALEASVSAAGAGFGIKVSDPVFQQKIKDGTISALDSLGLSPYRKSREFIVTGGMSQLNKFSNEEASAALTTVREIRNILGFERVGPEKHLLLQHSNEKTGKIPIPQLADLLASCNPENLSPAQRASHLFPNAEGPVYLERGNESRIRLVVGDKAPQWKSSTGGNRILLGGPESKINAMAPLLVGDPHDPDGAASKAAWSEFNNHLARGKKIGLDGISTDVWWGLVERKQGQFDWKYYDKLSSQIIGAGLKWVPILSFHSAGGNVGDNVNVPLPLWVWNHVSNQLPGSGPDVGKFKSEQGNLSSEYIQFWADKQAIPLYKNVMTNFANHFAGKAGQMSEINISLGPAGEARYPSYNQHDKMVDYPSRGTLQSYSDLAKADFRNWVMDKYKTFDSLEKAWGGKVENIEPPVNVDAFFRDKVHTNTQYGRDYFDWYQGTLIKHIQGVMGTAFDVYGQNRTYANVDIGMKIPGIHWRIGTNGGDNRVIMSDRLAELTAGMIRTSSNDWARDDLGNGYRPLLSGIKDLMSRPGGERLVLHFTALEMPDGQDAGMGAKAMPYTLANWVGRESQRQGLRLKGENALGGNLQNPDAWRILGSHLLLPSQSGYYNGLTLLRLSDVLGSTTSTALAEQLIRATKSHQVAPAAKNAG